MPTATDQPKYLMCARALALLTGLAAGATGCGSSLVPENGPKDAATQTYDGGIMGLRPPPYDGSFIGIGAPYDGGVVGSGPILDAHPTAYDGAVIGIGPLPPYDGGDIGVRVNPDANVHADAQTSPYDGGFLGVRINPDAL